MRALAIALVMVAGLACPALASETRFEEVPGSAAQQPDATAIQPGTEPAAEPKPEPEPEPKPAPKPVAVKAAPGSVRMLDFSFSPATITVNVGESVTWVNAGEEPHNAVGDNFSTALLNAGKSASETFASAGTFSYICTVHPQMKGTVKVLAAASSQPQGGAEDSSTGDDAAAAADTDTNDGPQLAQGGLDAWVLGLAGVALLAAGVALRRRTA